MAYFNSYIVKHEVDNNMSSFTLGLSPILCYEEYRQNSGCKNTIRETCNATSLNTNAERVRGFKIQAGYAIHIPTQKSCRAASDSDRIVFGFNIVCGNCDKVGNDIIYNTSSNSPGKDDECQCARNRPTRISLYLFVAA